MQPVNRYLVFAIGLVLSLLLSACPGMPAPTLLPADAPAATATAAPAMSAPVNEMTVEIGEIASQALADNLFGDPATRKFVVMLPPSYATSSHSYPVVYALHDWDRSEYSLVMPIKDGSERLLRQGAEEEMIFVFPNGANSFSGTSYLSSPTTGDYETYISRELVDYIDAQYRTIPASAGRGIIGCGGFGGTGAILLAMKYPDIFGVAGSLSGAYDHEHGPWLQWGAEQIRSIPADFAEIGDVWPVWVAFALASVAAPNPDKPPFYLDMPYEMVNGKGQLVPEVFQKIIALDAAHQLLNYQKQSTKLRGMMIYHGKSDPYNPVENARIFDTLLTDAAIEHDYLEVSGGNCATGGLQYEPILEFVFGKLVFAPPTASAP